MKKKCWLLLLLTLMLVLSGCGKVRETEISITKIGNVTFSSGDDIARAQAMYDQLSAKQQSKVSNADVLRESAETYALLLEAQEAITPVLETLSNIMEYEEALYKAHELYMQLPTAQQGLFDAEDFLENYEKLTVKRTEISQAEEAIKEIGTVSLSSESVIASARHAYTVLERDQKDVFSPELVQILTDAELAYEELLFEQLQNYSVQGDYANVLQAGRAFLQNQKGGSHRDEARTLLITALLKLTEMNLSSNSVALEAAMQYFDECRKYTPQKHCPELYETVITKLTEALLKHAQAEIYANNLQEAWAYYRKSDKYNAQQHCTYLYNQVSTAIENTRPRSGKILANQNVIGGYCRMIVKANSEDVLFKLIDTVNPQRYVCFYVRANEQATVNIQDGSYAIRYCSGETWYGMEDYFGSDTSYHESESIAQFTTSYDGSYVNYSELTYTLLTYFGGNTSSERIDKDEF